VKSAQIGKGRGKLGFEMSELPLNIFSLRDENTLMNFFGEETNVSGWRAITCLQELRADIDLSAERFDLPSLRDGLANSIVKRSLVTCGRKAHARSSKGVPA